VTLGITTASEQARSHSGIATSDRRARRGRQLNARSDGAGTFRDGQRRRRGHGVRVVVDGDDGRGRADGDESRHDGSRRRELAVVELRAMWRGMGHRGRHGRGAGRGRRAARPAGGGGRRRRGLRRGRRCRGVRLGRRCRGVRHRRGRGMRHRRGRARIARGRAVGRRDGDRMVLAVALAVVPQIGQVARPADWGSTAAKQIVDKFLVAWVTTVSSSPFRPAVLGARHTRIILAFNESQEAKGEGENESGKHLDLSERVKTIMRLRYRLAQTSGDMVPL